MTNEPLPVTRRLAEFALAADWTSLSTDVQGQAIRDCVNFVGCALGGARHDAVERTVKAAAPFAGGGEATLIGREERLTPLDAALVNCQASAANAYDDTHLATVLHPAGPVAAPLLAEAERRPVSGEEFLAALVVGVEVSCRVGKMLAAPPAEAEVGWYMTSVASPIGAAAGMARLLGLDIGQATHALGLAATQSAGFRQTHGSMCTSLSPANASRAGYWAAVLAAEGVTATETTLEGRYGFADLFAPAASLENALGGLGDEWEALQNMAKPYPCGIVIHPILDGCLEIANSPGFDAEAIKRIDLGLHPLCLTLTDRPAPPNAQLAQVSLQHWAAATLVRRAAGIEEGEEAAVHDPAILAARRKIHPTADASVGRDGALVRIEMAGGEVHERRVAHGIGSLARPMTDEELDAKFMGQAVRVLPVDRSRALLRQCREAARLEDISAILH